MRKSVIMALCIIFFSVLLVPRVALGDSTISQIQDVLDRMDREFREFKDAGNSLMSGMPATEQQYQPNEIDKVLGDSRKTLEIEQGLARLTLDYMGKVRSSLTALPELLPYLERFDSIAQSLDSVAQSVISNEQQQLDMLEQMRQAYYNNDTPGWNSLNQQYESLQARDRELSSQLKDIAANETSLMNEAKDMLRGELTNLQQAQQQAVATPAPVNSPASKYDKKTLAMRSKAYQLKEKYKSLPLTNNMTPEEKKKAKEWNKKQYEAAGKCNGFVVAVLKAGNIALPSDTTLLGLYKHARSYPDTKPKAGSVIFVKGEGSADKIKKLKAEEKKSIGLEGISGIHVLFVVDVSDDGSAIKVIEASGSDKGIIEMSFSTAKGRWLDKNILRCWTP